MQKCKCKCVAACFADLSELNFLWWFEFKLEPTFASFQAASHNDARYTSGQNCLKNYHIDNIIWIGEKECTNVIPKW